MTRVLKATRTTNPRLMDGNPKVAKTIHLSKKKKNVSIFSLLERVKGRKFCSLWHGMAWRSISFLVSLETNKSWGIHPWLIWVRFLEEEEELLSLCCINIITMGQPLGTFHLCIAEVTATVAAVTMTNLLRNAFTRKKRWPCSLDNDDQWWTEFQLDSKLCSKNPARIELCKQTKHNAFSSHNQLFTIVLSGKKQLKIAA